MKVCTQCKIPKEESEFLPDRRSKKPDKLTPKCTVCMRAYQKAERERLREYNIEYKRLYQKANKPRLNAISTAYGQKNLDKRRIYLKGYNKRRQMLNKKRRETDLFYHTCGLLRCGVTRAFSSKGWGKQGRSSELLGADFETVMKYIERQFKKGMSWERRGDIHIDHIVPLSSAKTIDELKTLCHYTNLQPLWKLDNLRKNKTIPQVQLKMTI